MTVVTRFPLGLAARGGWQDTTLVLPDGDWVDLVSGRDVAGGVVPLAASCWPTTRSRCWLAGRRARSRP